MKHIAILVIVLALVGLMPAEGMPAPFHTRIVILDFQVQGIQDSGKQSELGRMISIGLTKAMEGHKGVEVTDSEEFSEGLQTRVLQFSDFAEGTSPIRFDNPLSRPVTAIISGSAIVYQGVLEIHTRIVNPLGGFIIATRKVSSPIDGALESLLARLSEKISGVFPLSGYIVHRSGNRVTIDMGWDTSLVPGERYTVFSETVIGENESGKISRVLQSQTGIVRIKTIGKNIATAVILNEKTRNGITYGQRVSCTLETASSGRNEHDLISTREGA